MRESGTLAGIGAMARVLERVVQLPQPAMIAPLRVLFVPAASARPGVGAANKPLDVAFGLLLALLIRPVCRCLKQGADRSIDQPIGERVIGAQLGFQEKLCARLENGLELRTQ